MIKATNQFINILLFFSILLIVIRQPVGVRVGDGMEYYSMLINFAHSFLPYATRDTLAIYDGYVETTSNIGFLSSDFLTSTFNMYMHEGKLEFPHFWFYSLLAVPFYFPLKLLGSDIGLSFTLVNLLCLVFLLKVSNDNFGEKGVLTSLVIIVSSPLIWYVNKAHTEFFTVTLVISGTIFLLRSKLLWSSLVFAVIGTQNPPFCIVSAFIGLFSLIYLKREIFKIKNFVKCLLIFFTLLLHPLYYYVQLGVITPQLIFGIVNEPFTIKRSLIFILDLDIGLLVNWLLGSLFLVISLFLISKEDLKSLKRHMLSIVIIVGSCIIFMYSHSRTININHGAVVHMSRYALWYIGFFFPIIYFVISKISLHPIKVIVISIFIGLLTLHNVAINDVKRYSNYLNQSSISKFIYRKFPFLYDPEPEIFVEKIVKREVDIRNYPEWAVSNDTGNKVLVLRRNFENKKNTELSNILNSKFDIRGIVYDEAVDYFAKNPTSNYVYVNISDENIKYNNLLLNELVNLGSDKSDNLLNNFSIPEGWGRWISGTKGSILFFLNSNVVRENGYLVVDLGAVPFLYHGVPSQNVEISLNDRVIFDGKIDRETNINVKVERSLFNYGNNKLDIELGFAERPSNVGLGEDNRKLGLAIKYFVIRNE